MANIVQLKRSSVPGKVPDAANVDIGEPVVNLADKIIYTKNSTGTVIVVGAGTTSNITEGTNLYFSNARVYANIAPLLTAASGTNVWFSNTVPVGGKIGDTWVDSDSGKEYFYFSDGDSSQWVEDATGVYVITDPIKANIADLTTANVTEVTNLYFTNARVYANVTQLDYASNTYVVSQLSQAGFNPFLLSGM